MRIPTEHFSHVPVVAISPSQLASPEEPPSDCKSHDAATFSRHLMSRLLQTDSPQRSLNSVGSAPSSPKLSRGDTTSSASLGLGLSHSQHGSTHGSQPSSGPGSTAESVADSTEGPVSLPTLSPDSNSSDRRYVTCSFTSVFMTKHLASYGVLNNTCLNGIKTVFHLLVLFIFYYYFSSCRAKFNRSKTLGRPEKERLKGLQMIVCLDCKAMVLQIIKSSRTTRTNTIRNLTLNLSPVY